MRGIAAVVLALTLLPAIATARSSAKCDAPADLRDGWKVAAPADEGLDAAAICAIGPHLDEMTDTKPHAVVVVRHGFLVYEHYFTGGDEFVPGQVGGRIQRDASTLHDVHSITKSIMALLTGIAFDRGWLKDINAPVFSFLPQYADLRAVQEERIRLRDLLTMSSGLVWPEITVPYGDPANAAWQMSAAPDPFRFLLARPLEAMPGTLWNYNSGGVELLGVILQKASGRSLDRIAKEALFEPLGITDWHWGAASFGLQLRPRDLAKIGQLVLNHGVWDGHRIISATWVTAMTTPQIALPLRWPWGRGYGYLWWLGRSAIGGRDTDWVGVLGRGGQRLYVVPSLDLVVGITAGDFAFHDPEDPAASAARDMVLRAGFAH